MTLHLQVRRAATALVLSLAFGVIASACDVPASTSTAPPVLTADARPETLALTAGPSAGALLTVDLVYLRSAEQAAPRMMELWIERGAGLTYVGAEPLVAVEAADKALVVQERGDALRVIVYASANQNPLDSGPLARLSFRRASGGDATLSLVPQLPIFAPAPANDGLLLGPPLVLSAATSLGGPQ